MTNKERDKLRKLQDKFLKLWLVRNYEKEMGDKKPLFGPGTPSTSDLRKCLYVEYKERMEQIMREEGKI